MNALLESLLVPEGATYTYFHRRLDERIPFNWHYHREFELTLTMNSEGQRYVGDSIEPYGDGDLVLVGSNLPHTWMSQRKVDEARPHVAHVFWIKSEWLDALIETLLELRPLKALLLQSARGVVFSQEASKVVRGLVADMDSVSPAIRVIRLIEVLTVLSEDIGVRRLTAPCKEQGGLSSSDRPRIERALDYIHKNYEAEEISMAQLAEFAALSVSGLHRLFKRHTRQTVSEYIRQLKIGKACSLLVSTDKPISRIADEVGYGNLSHFNRQFLSIKGRTPREFRRAFAKRDASDPLSSTALTFPESAQHNGAPQEPGPGILGSRVVYLRGHPTGLTAIANSDL